MSGTPVFIEDLEEHKEELKKKKKNNHDFPALDGSLENCVINGISPRKSGFHL